MSEFVQRVTGRAAPPLAFLFCALISGAIIVNFYDTGKIGNDFGVYWRAANQPADLVYFWNGQYPFSSLPTMLVWVFPLSIAPKWPAYFLFTAFSAVAFVLSCRPYLSKTAIILSLISPPFLRGTLTGQVSTVLSALLLWACGTGNRIAAGMAFGVIASIKPQLVIMAPLMLALNRDWKAIIAAGATFLGLVMVSILAFGSERWPEWLVSMDHFQNWVVYSTGILALGITPTMIAERLGLASLPFLIGGTVAGAALVYKCRSLDPLGKSAAILIASLMAAPYALVYDLTAVVPLLAVAILGGRIWAVLGIATILHPIPLIVAAWELLRRSTAARIGGLVSEYGTATLARNDGFRGK